MNVQSITDSIPIWSLSTTNLELKQVTNRWRNNRDQYYGIPIIQHPLFQIHFVSFQYLTSLILTLPIMNDNIKCNNYYAQIFDSPISHLNKLSLTFENCEDFNFLKCFKKDFEIEQRNNSKIINDICKYLLGFCCEY